MTSQPPLLHVQEPKTKIAWIENADIIGGAELFSLDMIEKSVLLSRRPVQIDVFSGGNNSVFSENLARISKNLPEGITITHQDIFLPQLKPFSLSKVFDFFGSVKDAIGIIKKEDYETVYCNTVRSAMVIGVAQFFFPKKTKTIFMAHDYTFPKFFIRLLIPRFSQVLSCSYSVKQYLIENGVKPWHAEVIENGIDIDAFAAISPINPPLFTIGIIGRITEWKGQMTVLRAAKWIQENAKEYPFSFRFYGQPSQKEEDKIYEEKLVAYIKENNVTNVSFEGFTPIEQALQESQIVIHASEKAEPFGRVPIEAAGSERIVCLSNIGTPAQIFEDKKTAFFFEPGNSESLAHMLVIIAHNKEKALDVARAGKEMVQDKFNINVLAKRFWGFFS